MPNPRFLFVLARSFQAVVSAKLWGRHGDINEATAIYGRDMDRFGNGDGALVPEAQGAEDIGTWERSAICAKFYLVGKLKTRGSHHRPVFEEVLPSVPMVAMTASSSLRRLWLLDPHRTLRQSSCKESGEILICLLLRAQPWRQSLSVARL